MIVELITKLMMALAGQKYEKPLPGLLEPSNGEASQRLGF